MSIPPDISRVIDRGSTGRMAGGWLISTAVISALMVWARIASETDHPTLAGTLEGISHNPGFYGLAGVARLVSGLTLVAAAWCLMKTWIIRQRLGSPLVAWLLGMSGGCTAISGLASLWLAMTVPLFLPVASGPEVSAFFETALSARELSGKTGFALAGLALIVASRSQWKVGGTLRQVSPGSAILGTTMQFIWVDSATPVHPVVGAVFFLWLLVVGTMLVTGRHPDDMATVRRT